MPKFKLVSDYKPKGDQPRAIRALNRGLDKEMKHQVLLGVTGSGKTFAIANAITHIQRPTLIISHNKTLAAQLYSEFRGFFPENAVEYFVSYYDYYQPEAYLPHTDTYIEKDSSINDEIDRLRLKATSSLMSRDDVVIVASVSCIYGLGSPDEYKELLVFVAQGEEITREEILKRLVGIQYERNDIDFARGRFRVRGDTIEIFPAYEESAYRIELFGNKVEKITQINPVTGKKIIDCKKAIVYPAKHFVTTSSRLERAMKSIEEELKERLIELHSQNKLLEAQRLETRTKYDLEMMAEIGYCSGIENYSRHLSARPAGSRPWCLLDYFPEDFLLIIDESHQTIPQLNGMYNGDNSRKKTLVEHGFRLPSALDNRPLKFKEFERLMPQTIYVSATPGPYEIEKSEQIAEQIIRPTGLIDPKISVRPTANQIDDLIEKIKERVKNKERVLVTTLTKRMAEDLADYLTGMDLKVRYLHSEINTIKRVEILRDLRAGEFDCLVGINLLREGLDLPEVSLIAILDADKEGFLRSETSLIQVTGRAARNVNGEVIMYADRVTGSMKRAIDETNRRRAIQLKYNKEHHITPKTIQKSIQDMLGVSSESKEYVSSLLREGGYQYLPARNIPRVISDLERQMKGAADNLEFEIAAMLRDEIKKLKERLSYRG
ncbi:excinuclease ABC subunit UvrB [bacterium]|nr:excinuclease ABC subunit UvrB [bacterium]